MTVDLMRTGLPDVGFEPDHLAVVQELLQGHELISYSLRGILEFRPGKHLAAGAATDHQRMDSAGQAVERNLEV